MKNKKYCLYIHIVDKNISKYKKDKYYIGITSDVDKRWINNGANYKGQIFYNAIEKYGWDNIHHKILLENLTFEEAKEKEKEYIILYNSKIGQDGYNVFDGGEDISEKRKNAKNVYCIDLGIVFRSAKEASEYTKESKYTIRNKCVNYENKLYNVKKGYRYCYSEYLYRYFDENTNKEALAYVDLDSGKFYLNKTKNRIHKSTILDLDRFYHLKNKGILNNRKRIMFLYDYLYLFKNAKNGSIFL